MVRVGQHADDMEHGMRGTLTFRPIYLQQTANILYFTLDNET